MKYRTERARELDEMIKAIRKEYEEEKNRCQEIFFQYYNMEGMYGRKAHSPWDCGQGMRGYHYEYPSEEIRKKEEKERDEFLKKNNYKSQFTVMAEMNKELEPIEEEFSLEQYGMTTEERKIKKQIEYYERAIAKREKEIAEYKAKMEELKNR
jgi:hypothetical protein